MPLYNRSKDNFNILAIKKIDKTERWVFFYDNLEDLIGHLLTLSYDEETDLDWNSIEQAIERAMILEATYGPIKND